ncbi:MAG: queuosine precursor transporter [Flavobacteriaceae bacterium]
MTSKDLILARRLYLILGLLFVTSLIVSNLIFKKFFYYYPFDSSLFGVKLFEISVGILPYPITFLITDLISEIYGKKKANEVVFGGIIASFFAMGIIYISNVVPATSWSPVSDKMFSTVFGSTSIAVISSMLAYLFAQFVDIQIYHFWKSITKGKHLWLRNNFSTFLSQFIDTATVLILLCSFGEIQWRLFTGLLMAGFLFKVIIAALDTPILYIFVFFIRKRFKLEIDQEIELI